MPTLLHDYKKLIKDKNFSHDTAQEGAIYLLEDLLNGLKVKKTFWPFAKKKTTRGVYLHGGVGRGKSMIMDLFFDKVPLRIKKRRVHFHQFMIETHDWLHKNRNDGLDNLLMRYADKVSNDMRLLCFDEFHVTDVADAMILKRLFTALLERGITVVATSNWAPSNLYEGGLKREVFLPFIQTLKDNMHVVQLDGGRDYRSLADPSQDVYYFHPRDDKTKKIIDALFLDFANGVEAKTEKVTVKGRKLNVMAAGDVARFTFYELCEKALGAEDYIKIAKKFDTVFIENIPVMGDDMRNEAKRFILLIDCLYEAQCRLVISAAVNIYDLYKGHDHEFEFDRCVSRLMEMQSLAYHDDRMKK